jgi:hypothetical protein
MHKLAIFDILTSQVDREIFEADSFFRQLRKVKVLLF